MSYGVILTLDGPIPRSYAPILRLSGLILRLYGPIPTSDRRVPRGKGSVQVVEAVMRAAMRGMYREWRGTFCEWVPGWSEWGYFTRFLRGRQGGHPKMQQRQLLRRVRVVHFTNPSPVRDKA